VKRSDRNEPMLVAIQKCMEATGISLRTGISLYSYLYLKLAKTVCLSYYLKQGDVSVGGGEGVGGGGINNVSTCK
jgi:hypothetical protein